MEANVAALFDQGDEPGPTRGTATLLTLVFGPVVGFLYLGRSRQAVLWGITPFALAAVLWEVIGIAQVHALELLFVPSFLLLLLVRPLAMLVISRAPQGAFRRAPRWHLFAGWLAGVAYVVAASHLVRGYVGETFKIASGSMMPTLLPQDHVFVSKAVFSHPKRGELVSYVDRSHRNYILVKRVLALGGEGIEFKEGRPWINGWQVPHCVVARDALPGVGSDGGGSDIRGEIDLEYLGDRAYLVFFDHAPLDADANGPWVIDRDEVFVVSDNRNNGLDSRMLSHGQGGGIPSSDVTGVPLFLWLAFKPNESIDWSRVNLPLDEPRLPSRLASHEPALKACLQHRPAQTDPPPAR